MKLTSTFLFSAAVVALMSVVPAGAAEYTMILAHSLSDPQHPIYKSFEKIKADIEERSGGRIEVQHLPGGAMGGDREAMESMMLGDVQFSPQSTSAAFQFVPEFAVFDLPYTLPADTAKLNQLINKSEFTELFKTALDAKGIHWGGIFNAGFRNLTTSKTEVHTPDDIAKAGLRIRVQENPIHIALWRALGAAPTPIAFPEIYGALQQGVVDGQENPYGHIISQRFYEVQKYVINTNHIFLANVNLINKAWFDSLPPDLQKVVDDAMLEACDYQWKLQDEDADKQRATLASHLTVIDLTDEEVGKFREKTTEVEKLVRERAGDAIVDALYVQLKK
jgi:C4-dicarboxylate-binding protein DctP